MADSKYLFLQIAFFVLLLSLCPSSSTFDKNRKGMTPWSPPIEFKGCFSKVFAFGDSFTDTGNAQLMGGFKSFMGFQFSKFFGSTDKSLSGYRQCNGRLVIDFLCESLSLPHLQPYKNSSSDFSSGVNFAIAGATALSSDFFTQFKIGHSLMWKSIPESFQTQIDWFHRSLSGKDEAACKAELEDALIWIGEMGGNDYARLYGASIPTQLLTELAVGHVCTLMKAVLDKGAKYIVVQGLPPAGCSPVHLLFCPTDQRDQYGCSGIANSWIIAHNNHLQRKVEEFRLIYRDAMIVYADYFNAYQTILANYKKYQFEEPFKACCGSGDGQYNFDLQCLCGATGSSSCKDASKYICWDGIHPTESMHQQISDLFFNQGFCKPSFSDLLRKKRGGSK